MKPSLSSIVFLCAALGACAPSPYYSGNKSGLAPGAVPRDGLGRPVLNGKAIEYDLPPAAAPVMTDIAGRPMAPAASANQIIYFDDLRYADAPQKRAGGDRVLAAQ